MNESLQNGHRGVRKWLPMMVLGTAMLVTVFDATLLGVAMVQLTEDFDTDIRTVQLIVTMYALTVGAFMLASGKVGDTIGRRKAYAVGAVIYAAGSALTIVAGNVWVALLGWAILKGIAASLMLPQIEALIPFNYRGKDRALAFAMIGGIGGAGSAIGLIGGCGCPKFGRGRSPGVIGAILNSYSRSVLASRRSTSCQGSVGVGGRPVRPCGGWVQ